MFVGVCVRGQKTWEVKRKFVWVIGGEESLRRERGREGEKFSVGKCWGLSGKGRMG